MRPLLEAGEDSNSREPDGVAPLYCAVFGSNLDAVRVLFQAKANPLSAVATDVPAGRFIRTPLSILRPYACRQTWHAS